MGETFLRNFVVRAAAVALLSSTVLAGAALAADAPLSAPRFGTWGVDTSGGDHAVKPGDDFFRYANGKAVDAMVIPPDQARWGSFNTLRDLSLARQRAILEEAAAHPTDAEQAKLGAYYKAFMDTARIEALGRKPLDADLAKVRAATTRADFARLMGRSVIDGTASIYGFGISPDAKDPNHYAVSLGQGGLGLPDRDYYLDAKYADKKAAYQSYVAKMLTLAGWPEPEARAADILAFETRLAQAHWSRIESRNRDKTYNPMTLADLKAAAPGFDWDGFFAAAELPNLPRVVVAQNTAVPKIAAVFNETPIATLQAWEAFNLADRNAGVLPDRFVQARFDFRAKTLSGVPELEPRWKRAVGFIDGAMGEALGKIYVARYFPPESRAKMQDLVENLRAAYRQRITNLPWMSPATKQQALEKLAAFNPKIGYPSKWRDYSALQVLPTDLYGDVKRTRAFEWDYRRNRLNQPVDRTEWGMTPATVNAYYNPTLNEVVFPAAILQPPFFDPQADPAVNYGAIGAVIGHEMSHGFDDQGRKSDGKGVLRDWWTAEDAAKFQAQTTRLGAQYDAFEVAPGFHVQGKLTMGENIGDLGGILAALDAYHLSLGGKPAPVIDGLTGDQRFFLAFAQVWRSKSREEALKQQVATDAHSPERFRVNGTVRNVDAWYAAFDVKPGDALYVPPEERVRIW